MIGRADSGPVVGRRPGGQDTGAGTVLIAAVILVLLVLGAAAALVAGYGTAAHRARAGADLTALSAAQATVSGLPTCPAAADTARRNRTRLDSCALTGAPPDFVVAVAVSVPAPLGLPVLPARVTGRAWAGSQP